MSFERWNRSEGGLFIPSRKLIAPKASMVVNPSRFASAAINANVAMAISATTTITLPSHASGDYLLIFAYRDGNNNTPTVPAGWTALTATGLIGVNSNCAVLGYKVAASGAETSGTWTNASGLVCAVVKQAGSGPLGNGNNSGQQTGTGSIVTYSTFSLASALGHSVVIGFGGQRDTTGSFNAAASGMTIGSFGAGASCIVGGHYTTTGVTSFGNTNVNIGSGSFGWATIAAEITGAA